MNVSHKLAAGIALFVVAGAGTLYWAGRGQTVSVEFGNPRDQQAFVQLLASRGVEYTVTTDTIGRVVVVPAAGQEPGFRAALAEHNALGRRANSVERGP